MAKPTQERYLTGQPGAARARSKPAGPKAGTIVSGDAPSIQSVTHTLFHSRRAALSPAASPDARTQGLARRSALADAIRGRIATHDMISAYQSVKTQVPSCRPQHRPHDVSWHSTRDLYPPELSQVAARAPQASQPDPSPQPNRINLSFSHAIG